MNEKQNLYSRIFDRIEQVGIISKIDRKLITKLSEHEQRYFLLELNRQLNNHSDSSWLKVVEEKFELWRRLVIKRTSTSSAQKVKVSSAPGSFVLMIAEFLCSKKTYERVFVQSILDMREEYFDALHANRKWKSRWVIVRAYMALCATIALQSLSLPVKIVKTFWG